MRKVTRPSRPNYLLNPSIPPTVVSLISTPATPALIEIHRGFWSLPNNLRIRPSHLHLDDGRSRMDTRNRMRLRWGRKRQGEMRKVVRRTVIRESCWGDNPGGSQRIKGSIRIQRPTESSRRHPICSFNHLRTPNSGRTPRRAGNNRGRPNRGPQEFFCRKGMQDYIS